MKNRFLAIIIVLMLIIIPLGQKTGLTVFAEGAGSIPVTYRTTSSKVLSTSDELINAIRTGMLERKDTMTFRIKNSIRKQYDSMDQMMDEVFAYDDKETAKDGDYLKFSVSRWDISTSWSSLEDSTELSLQVNYRTTLNEEKAVDKKITAVLKSLKLEEATDYEKVKAIHDYIIKRNSYDTTHDKRIDYAIHLVCQCSFINSTIPALLIP